MTPTTESNLPHQPASILLRVIRGIEDAVLALLLAAMILIAATQVVLRNFFDSGLLWGNSAVQVMLIWVAMLGAMVASRTDHHIRIDIASRYLPDHLQPHVRRLVYLFTAALLGIFAWSSFVFVRDEYAYGDIAFGIVPTWLCQAVMPFAAAIMSLRYAIHTVRLP